MFKGWMLTLVYSRLFAGKGRKTAGEVGFDIEKGAGAPRGTPQGMITTNNTELE